MLDHIYMHYYNKAATMPKNAAPAAAPVISRLEAELLERASGALEVEAGAL